MTFDTLTEDRREMETNTEEVQAQEPKTPENKESPFALLFELEGVAVNGRRAAFDVLRSILSDHHHKLRAPDFSRYCLHPSPYYYVPTLLDALGAKISAEKLAEDVRSGVVMNITSNAVSLQPGLAGIFDAARERKIPLAALSSLEESAAQSIIKKLGLDKRETRLFAVNDEVDDVFPRADTWLKIAKAIKRTPRRCLVLASNKASSRAALSAGMKCVVIPDEFTAFQDFGGADKVLDSLEDIVPAELLEELCPADS